MTWLRSATFNVWFFGVTFLLLLMSLPLRAVAPQRAMSLVRLWSRLVLAGLRVLCVIRWQVSGLDRVPRGGALIASQHQSAFDTMIWFLLVPDPSYVLKRELLRIPLFGGMCRVTGMIAIDRDGGASALRELVRAGGRAAAEGRQIVIFPEGTRVEPGRHAVLQPGIAALAARTGLPVLPVATDSGRCWGRRAFRKRAGTIHIAILPPLAPGLPRPALLGALLDSYSTDPATVTRPVDNSVGAIGGRLPSRAN